MADTTFRVSAPGRPGSVRVLRSIANAAAASMDLGYDVIEDIDLALDEASAALLNVAAGGSFDCAIRAGGGGLAISLSLEGGAASIPGWPPQDWESSLGGMVMAALASDVVLDCDGAAPRVSFRMPADH